MSEFARRLQQVYGQKPIETDQFGRRPALPAEVAHLLDGIQSTDFPWAVIQFPPTAEDIQEKDDGATATTTRK